MKEYYLRLSNQSEGMLRCDILNNEQTFQWVWQYYITSRTLNLSNPLKAGCVKVSCTALQGKEKKKKNSGWKVWRILASHNETELISELSFLHSLLHSQRFALVWPGWPVQRVVSFYFVVNWAASVKHSIWCIHAHQCSLYFRCTSTTPSSINLCKHLKCNVVSSPPLPDCPFWMNVLSLPHITVHFIHSWLYGEKTNLILQQL